MCLAFKLTGDADKQHTVDAGCVQLLAISCQREVTYLGSDDALCCSSVMRTRVEEPTVSRAHRFVSLFKTPGNKFRVHSSRPSHLGKITGLGLEWLTLQVRSTRRERWNTKLSKTPKCTISFIWIGICEIIKSRTFLCY
jgi:hypothetical protein